MLPFGHVAVAYLLYSTYVRARFRRPPRRVAVLALLVGSQLPDLIDKPLAWGLGVFPRGRYLAHSLLFAAVLAVVVYGIGIALDRIGPATAFVSAYVSHLFADLSPRVLLGYPFGSEYLLWPVVPVRSFNYSHRIFEPPALVEWLILPVSNSQSIWLLLQGLLFVLACWLWYVDGCPGLGDARNGVFSRNPDQ